MMTCEYCQFSVPDGEHRCAHCGRRMRGGAAEGSPRYAGATALAAVASASTESMPKAPAPQPEIVSRGPAQPSLFPYRPVSNVPLEVVHRGSSPASNAPPVSKTKPSPPEMPDAAQSKIDFLPPAPIGPRRLKTTVEAVIYCNDPVATPVHRMLAGALDASMILIAFGLFSIIFYISGGTIAWDTRTLVIFPAAFGLIALFYGLLWAVSGRETPGMHWTHLRLVNFDGFPPDGKSRALRIAGVWLSFCSGAIGLLWSLVDEENLTWHDHMSKTFPTLRESNSSFFRQR